MAQSLQTALTFWCTGLVLATLYYAIRPLRRPLYFLWMKAVSPLAWVVSNALLAAVYFLVITPIGLVVRAFGRDQLARQFERSSASYWIEETPVSDTTRYFRQY